MIELDPFVERVLVALGDMSEAYAAGTGPLPSTSTIVKHLFDNPNDGHRVRVNEALTHLAEIGFIEPITAH